MQLQKYVNVDQYSPTAKKFIHPETDEFSDLLYESTILRMSQSKLYSADKLKTFFKFQLVIIFLLSAHPKLSGLWKPHQKVQHIVAGKDIAQTMNVLV